MDNLGARIEGLVGRLSGRATPGLISALPLDRAATEAAYRQTLRRWFELTAQRLAADHAETNQVYQELLRLIDEVGEPWASTLRRQWAREWWRETGICPYCGEAGTYHETDRDREANQ